MSTRTSRWRTPAALAATALSAACLVVLAGSVAASADPARTAATSVDTTYLSDTLGVPASTVVETVTYDRLQWQLQQPGQFAYLIGDPGDAGFKAEAIAVDAAARAAGAAKVYWFDPNLSGSAATNGTVGWTVSRAQDGTSKIAAVTTTPAGAFTNTATSISVVYNSSFPTTFPFKIQVGLAVTNTLISPEVMTVTGSSGSGVNRTWTVTRGVDSTTKVVGTTGMTVALVRDVGLLTGPALYGIYTAGTQADAVAAIYNPARGSFLNSGLSPGDTSILGSFYSDPGQPNQYYAGALAQIQAYYPVHGGNVLLQAQGDIATATVFRRGAWTHADLKSEQNKAPVWLYEIDWVTPVDGGKWGSPHSLEHPFVFDNVARSESMVGPSHAGPQRMADQISTTWVAFARSGNPNTPKLPSWTPYSAPQRATMVFNDTSQVVDDPTKERRQAMQDALGLT